MPPPNYNRIKLEIKTQRGTWESHKDVDVKEHTPK